MSWQRASRLLSAKDTSLAIPGWPRQRKLAQLPIDSQFPDKSGSTGPNPATLSPGLDFETKLFYKPQAARLLTSQLTLGF
jgi:hypothetical protein